MKNTLQIDFQLLGTDMAPKDITRELGVIPEVALLRGERSKDRDLPRQNTWAVRSMVDSEDLADHWRQLSEMLNKSRDSIRDIAKSGCAKFTLIVNSENRIPSITIPSAMSEFAGYINAIIDIDHIQS